MIQLRAYFCHEQYNPVRLLPVETSDLFWNPGICMDILAINFSFPKRTQCLRPASGPTSGTTTRAVVSLSTTPTRRIPPNGAGSTRALASRHAISSRHVVTQQTRRNPSSSWQVWQDALDLTQSGGSGAVDCFFHYTTQLGFRNITAPQKEAVEVFVPHSVTNQHVM